MALSEVRQCQDENDDQYCATAVEGKGRSIGLWGVFHPERGGHWADDEEVANWAVVVYPPAEEDRNEQSRVD